MNFLYVLRSILALVVIIWLANKILHKLNDYMQGQSRAIEIIERFSISKNSSLAIVKILQGYYLMSFSEQSNEILKELQREEIEELIKIIEKQKSSELSFVNSEMDFSTWKEKYHDFLKSNRK